MDFGSLGDGDRNEAWSGILGHYADLKPVDFSFVYRVRPILTRSEVEALNSYVSCRICSPSLDHPQKKYVLNVRPMSMLSFNVQHIGRAVAIPEGDDLGFLVSHQRIVTAQGIRSITTTTERVIESDDTEKYAVAPRPIP